MDRRVRPQFGFSVALFAGTLIALTLCIQCIRTYLYTNHVLEPQQAGLVGHRELGQLNANARAANIGSPEALQPVVTKTFETADGRLLWLRIADENGRVYASSGAAPAPLNLPTRWFQDFVRTRHTAEGLAFVLYVPIHLPHPLPWHPITFDAAHHPPILIAEVAVSGAYVQTELRGLRQNLIIGVVASVALLAAILIIALRARQYLRGKYLESEMRLARRVQNDLRPKQELRSVPFDFAAAAIAADHVGGDFYDVFETESGRVGIVLGDVSGKGIPAALLVSVLQGAIRSATPIAHERACERINKMLCERTACERFATLFWAVFDPSTQLLHYVNAGHLAPMLRRSDGSVERLGCGGPVLGILPNAAYTSGTVRIVGSESLVVFSDGVTEANNGTEEEFGDQRLAATLVQTSENAAALRDRIMMDVSRFAGGTPQSDDRTLLVVNFPGHRTAIGNLAARSYEAELPVLIS